jgi:hypothetical protein
VQQARGELQQLTKARVAALAPEARAEAIAALQAFMDYVSVLTLLIIHSEDNTSAGDGGCALCAVCHCQYIHAAP